MNRLVWATLDPKSPRYPIWRKILGSDEIPLKTPTPHQATLGVPVQETNVQVYQLDAEALTKEQRDRLVTFCVERFGTTLHEVIEAIAREGFPIRKEDVLVAFSMRAFV